MTTTDNPKQKCDFKQQPIILSNFFLKGQVICFEYNWLIELNVFNSFVIGNFCCWSLIGP